MNFVHTNLNDAYTIEPELHKDKRGFFARTYCSREFSEHGISFNPVQANVSYNRHKHTLRGMHYQAEPHAEAKLVRCTAGSLFDVIIDLRRESTTYMQWSGFTLSKENRRLLYVPEGFAHGFMTLEDETEVSYLMSEFYTPDAGRGIRWDDPAFNIKWPAEVAVISGKDKKWPVFVEGGGA